MKSHHTLFVLAVFGIIVFWGERVPDSVPFSDSLNRLFGGNGASLTFAIAVMIGVIFLLTVRATEKKQK